jgi:putative endonuclease
VLWDWWRRWWSRTSPLGRRGEEFAARHLESLGYRIVERSYRRPSGEIDLVALDGRTVVFVEVKTRSSAGRGGPEAAVDRKKQVRLTRAAMAYLKRRRMLEQPARFDVVAVVWTSPDVAPEITHFRSAFTAVGSSSMFS